jgi:hypothetical protein
LVYWTSFFREQPAKLRCLTSEVSAELLGAATPDCALLRIPCKGFLGSQNPHPVPPKSRGTRMGHPVGFFNSPEVILELRPLGTWRYDCAPTIS